MNIAIMARQATPHQTMADCHPTRHLFREGLCRACFQLLGQLALGQLDQGLPLPIPNVEQRTVTSIPEDCPKCDGLIYCEAPTADDPTLARRVACAICGWDAVRRASFFWPPCR